jgi:hypothetical protein
VLAQVWLEPPVVEELVMRTLSEETAAKVRARQSTIS